MTSVEVEEAASRLDKAEQTRAQIELLSLRYPAAGMEAAYRVQSAFVQHKLARGDRRVGWKIGLTSRAMQSTLNIATPDSGVLLASMAFDDGASIPGDRFIEPRVEAELAFVMKGPVCGPNATLFDVLNATDYVVPAIEILDTRIRRRDAETGRSRALFDLIADNAANAGLVLGGRPARPDSIDMRWFGAIVSRNAAVEETGLGAGVLGHPATAVAWLANRLASYEGALAAGDIVLSGSFVRAIEARHGDTIVADFGSQGTVGVHFS